MRKNCLLLVVLFVFINVIHAQNIIYVTPNGNGNGSSWATAAGNLQTAIDSAARQTPKPDIWVAVGTYYGDGISTNNAFTMANGVNVYGGFAGNEPANYNLDLRDFETNTTILDGQKVQRVVYQAEDFTDTTTLDGFTVRNGNLANGNGAGVYLKANAKLNNCKVINNRITNHLTGHGSGIYAIGNQNNTVQINNCEIRNNSNNSNYGGGICSIYAITTNCLISNNIGAGVYVYSNSRFINCDIVNNWSSTGSAGIYSLSYYSNNDIVFINCIIWGNKQGETPNQFTGSGTESFVNCAIEGGIGAEGNFYLDTVNDGIGTYYPKFVNSSPITGIDTITPNIDWHLQSGSVCINRGNNVAITQSIDLDGNPRVQQDTVDIGCYESSYHSVPLSESPFADDIVYVKVGGTGSMNGTAWNHALPRLQEALSLAAKYNVDKVWVAAGTYYGDSITTNNAFTMTDGVDVYGGFAGNEPANYDLNLRDFETNETVLDGQHVQRVLFQETGCTDTTTWDGITIKNGYAINYGSGAYLENKSKLNHCKIINNSFDSQDEFCGGSGINAIYSTINNCTISDNHSTAQGAAIRGGGVSISNSIISNCVISGNSATNTNSTTNEIFGGGIYAYSSIISNCIINHNTVEGSKSYGGGIFTYRSTINNCFIHDNSASGTKAFGGGIWGTSYTVVANCDIHDNHSDDTGGGITTNDNTNVTRCKIYNNSSNFDGGGATFQGGIITDCEIYNNTATRNSGGVELYGATLYNCNIHNNTNTGTTPYGSGVYASTESHNNNLPTQLINCNIVNNLASGTTGSIYNKSAIDTIHNTFTNCIVWGNRDNGSSEQIAGDAVGFSYCAVEGGWTGTDNINLAANNSGDDNTLHYVKFLSPTAGAGADYDGGNWVFAPGSACIDAGTPDTAGLNMPLTDLLGFERIYNNRIDIGANEYFPGTSISENAPNSLSNSITLFPNPATNTVELQITNDKLQINEVEVYDMMGKIVKTTHALNPQSATINVTILSTGTYFVRVTTSDGNMITKKLIKR